MPNSSRRSPAGRSRAVLRELAVADREPIARLLEGTRALRTDEIAVALELVDLELAQPGSGYRFVVAEVDGAVAGYACFGATPCTLGTFDLYWIAVARELQGRGIGQVLVHRVEELVRADQGRLLLVETNGKPDYAPQRAFYARAGFREVARVPDFYEPGDDRVIFAKRP